jgi:hypothetical protein
VGGKEMIIILPQVQLELELGLELGKNNYCELNVHVHKYFGKFNKQKLQTNQQVWERKQAQTIKTPNKS